MTASTANTPRQVVKCSSWAPAIGATIGAVPLTMSSRAKNRASSSPSYRSRTMARAMTMPAAPAKPWTRRSASNAQMLGAAMHSADATA
jgi:hypothetical protein